MIFKMWNWVPLGRASLCFYMTKIIRNLLLHQYAKQYAVVYAFFCFALSDRCIRAMRWLKMWPKSSTQELLTMTKQNCSTDSLCGQFHIEFGWGEPSNGEQYQNVYASCLFFVSWLHSGLILQPQNNLNACEVMEEWVLATALLVNPQLI